MPRSKPTAKPTPSKRATAAPVDPLGPVFKALANSDRRAILDLLRDQPRTTGQLCQAIAWLDRCTVMLHLQALVDADLVIPHRVGRERWNYLNHEPIQRAYRRWIQPFAEPATEYLVQLKQRLEPKKKK